MVKKSKNSQPVKMTWGELGDQFGVNKTIQDALPSAPSGIPAEGRGGGRGKRPELRSDRSAWRNDGPQASSSRQEDDLFSGDWRSKKPIKSDQQAWAPSQARPFSLGLGKSSQASQESKPVSKEPAKVEKVEEKPVKPVEEVIDHGKLLQEALDNGKIISHSQLEGISSIDLKNSENLSKFKSVVVESVLEKSLRLKELHQALLEQAQVFQECVTEISIKSMTEERFLRIVQDSEMDLLNTLGLDKLSTDQLAKSLESLKLSALMPQVTDALNLEKIASETFAKGPDSIVSHLSQLDSKICDCEEFVAHMSKLIVGEYFAAKSDSSVLEKYEKVFKVLGSSLVKQEAIVLGAHWAWDANGMPKQLGKKCFADLHELELVVPEAFVSWRDCKTNRDHHKVKLLLQVSALVTDMIPQRHLSEDEEEEEEEEDQPALIDSGYMRDSAPSYR